MEAEAWAGDHKVSSAQGFPFVPFLFCIPILPTLQGLYYVQFDCYERPPQTSAIQMACQAPFPISST